MKTWDIGQEATEEDSAEGAVEVMGMEQDTPIMRVTLLNAQGSPGYKDGGGITPILVQPYPVHHRYPLLTRRNSS